MWLHSAPRFKRVWDGTQSALRTVYSPAARWGRHTALGHIEVSHVIFSPIRFHYLVLQLGSAKGTPLLCDSVKRFLGWFIRGGSEGGKIRVRLCALRPCVRDKACEAYSPSVSSQSSDSTSLSAQLQLSPRVLRGLRTGQVSANHSRSLRRICRRHPREVKWSLERVGFW